jgi:hypothetical protein
MKSAYESMEELLVMRIQNYLCQCLPSCQGAAVKEAYPADVDITNMFVVRMTLQRSCTPR